MNLKNHKISSIVYNLGMSNDSHDNGIRGSYVQYNILFTKVNFTNDTWKSSILERVVRIEIIDAIRHVL